MSRKLAAVALALAIFGGGEARAGSLLTVNIFSGSTTSGGGAPYTGFVGSFTSPDIMFATNTGYNWHPFGLGNFGADITGSIVVSASGVYPFTLNSDDGSQLFIDGGLVVNDGGIHPPNVATNTTFLTAGQHSLEVQFFECCDGPSGVDLTLPPGVNFGMVPEPSSVVLLGIGSVGLLGFGYRRWRQAA